MATKPAKISAAQLLAAINGDLEFNLHKQQQCGKALRALSAAIERAKDAPMDLLGANDLSALFSVIADQSLFLTTEAQDHLATARRLIA